MQIHCGSSPRREVDGLRRGCRLHKNIFTNLSTFSDVLSRQISTEFLPPGQSVLKKLAFLIIKLSLKTFFFFFLNMRVIALNTDSAFQMHLFKCTYVAVAVSALPPTLPCRIHTSKITQSFAGCA